MNRSKFQVRDVALWRALLLAGALLAPALVHAAALAEGQPLPDASGAKLQQVYAGDATVSVDQLLGDLKTPVAFYFFLPIEVGQTTKDRVCADLDALYERQEKGACRFIPVFVDGRSRDNALKSIDEAAAGGYFDGCRNWAQVKPLLYTETTDPKPGCYNLFWPEATYSVEGGDPVRIPALAQLDAARVLSVIRQGGRAGWSAQELVPSTTATAGETDGGGPQPPVQPPVQPPAQVNGGTLTINSTPAGATVLVDGQAIGQTPLEAKAVPAGPHQVVLRLAGHKDFPLTLTIREGRDLMVPALPLQPDAAPKALVTVNSIPPGATILLDGETVGQTPSNVPMSVGQHVLALKLDGYADVTREVELKPGEDLFLLPFQLKAQGGRINLTSDPAGATVLVNGQELGRTPCTVELPPGAYDLEFRLPDRPAVMQKVVLTAGQTQNVPLIELPAAQARLKVSSDPAGAAILLNGKSTGKVTPAELEVTPGAVRVQLQQEGYQIKELDVQVTAGQTTDVSARLEATFPPAGWPDFLQNFKPVAGLKYRVMAKDGMPQVFIPEGVFTMGDSIGDGARSERPVRRIHLSGYWMDLHEVTNRQYESFLNATGHKPDDRWVKWNQDTGPNYPACYVTWYEASAYADWAGRTLPTEAQWERAARGGLEGKRYEWGDNPDPAYANADFQDRLRFSYENHLKYCQPVCEDKPNGFGLFDMCGNVWEWSRDWFDDGWLQNMPEKDPVRLVPTREKVHTLRGGSWQDGPMVVRVSSRLLRHRDNFYDTFGFRCCSEEAAAVAGP